MSLKSHSGAVYNRHISSVERMLNKIDLLRKLKRNQKELLDKGKVAEAVAVGDYIYELESQDELDHRASCMGISENSIGTIWTF